MVKFKKNVKLQ